jgi:hypothetical protein
MIWVALFIEPALFESILSLYPPCTSGIEGEKLLIVL